MNKKYEFTDETIVIDNHTLHRIRAIRSFGNVEEGDLGGFIETENNLSHDRDCWVYDDAQIYGDARVYGSARVYGDAQVYGSARVYDDAEISFNASISGYAEVCKDAQVYGDARVYDNAVIFQNAQVYGYAEVCGNALICGYAEVCGNAKIETYACIVSTRDYITIGPLGSRNDTTTFYKTKDGSIMVTTGCFCGSIKAFEKAVKEEHRNNECAEIYRLYINIVKQHFSQYRKK